MGILVTGGTGFVGRALVGELRLGGKVCQIVSRSGGEGMVKVPGPGELFSTELISSVTHVVNLAGESIAGSRWSEQVRQGIMRSRVEMTGCIVASIRRNQELGLAYPKVMLNASAVGYYGTHPVTLFTEESENGNDFLAEVCRQWEGEALQAKVLGVRVLCLRFGHILEQDGGMLPRVAMPFRFGVGGYLGDGQQWMSWIHRKDLVEIVVQALDDPKWQGIYNLTTPEPVTMEEFMQVLGQTLGSKSRMRVPAFAARLLFGEMAQEVLLQGQKVFPQRLLEQGYVFKYPRLPEALADIYKK